MKLVTLVENTSCVEDLKAEHGLSLYIETGDRKLLFDTGQSALIRENAWRLGVDLKAVDTVVLSHGHYDHGGGLFPFFEENSQALVYASPLCFQEYYNGTKKYIGLNPLLVETGRFRMVDSTQSLGDGLTLIPGRMVLTPRGIPYYGLNVKLKSIFARDCFLHEQYLLLEEKGKRILFSGCSHRGILNITEHFRPDILIGGFHFKKLDPEADRQTLEENARALLQFPTEYYTCHCTGTGQYEVLKPIMGDRLHYLSAGSTLTL